MWLCIQIICRGGIGTSSRYFYWRAECEAFMGSQSFQQTSSGNLSVITLLSLTPINWGWCMYASSLNRIPTNGLGLMLATMAMDKGMRPMDTLNLRILICTGMELTLATQITNNSQQRSSRSSNRCDFCYLLIPSDCYGLLSHDPGSSPLCYQVQKWAAQST
jgi:hypothetical protein